jgi:hypothetical protein
MFSMFDFLKKLFSSDATPAKTEPMDILRKSGAYPKQYRAPTPSRPKPQTKTRESQQNRRSGDDEVVVQRPVIEDGGPGKNVLQRTRFVREDTGTHETLKIVDDAAGNRDDESGIDPYNTGQFDRSKSWDKHFKK